MALQGAARLDAATKRLSALQFPILSPISDGSIDFKVTGETLVMTTPSTGSTLPLWVVFVCDDIDTLTVAPEVSIGTGAGGNYDQILAATVLSGADASGKYIVVPITVAESVGPSTTIYVDVITGATATKADFGVVLLGVQSEQ